MKDIKRTSKRNSCLFSFLVEKFRHLQNKQSAKYKELSINKCISNAFISKRDNREI